MGPLENILKDEGIKVTIRAKDGNMTVLEDKPTLKDNISTFTIKHPYISALCIAGPFAAVGGVLGYYSGNLSGSFIENLSYVKENMPYLTENVTRDALSITGTGVGGSLGFAGGLKLLFNKILK